MYQISPQAILAKKEPFGLIIDRLKKMSICQIHSTRTFVLWGQSVGSATIQLLEQGVRVLHKVHSTVAAV